MNFVDTNIFIRYITDDLPEEASACEKIFRKAFQNEEMLFTTELVIAEIIWVLGSYYELAKDEVQEKVEKILNTPNLVCPNKELLLTALALHADKNIDYIDVYNSLILREQSVAKVYSYDKHYDRIEWLERIEPE